METSLFVTCCFVFFIAFSETYRVRNRLLKSRRLDVPNARSSHKSPTPRGGGQAIILAFLMGTTVGFLMNRISSFEAIASFAVGLGLGLIGWWDDRYDLQARSKLLAQFVVCCVLFYLFLSFGYGQDKVIFLIPAVFGFLWLTNLFNFMDGIDGIASVQAIASSIGALLVFDFQSVGIGQQWLLTILLFSCLGFLWFNWPPASIFMGDVGSATLGAIFSMFALIGALGNPLHLFTWLILLMPFIGDATVTLLRRLVQKENISQAHRSHAYQRASRYFGSHKVVTVAFGLFTLLICAPLAKLSLVSPSFAWFALLTAFGLTVMIALYFGAGCSDRVGRHAVRNSN